MTADVLMVPADTAALIDYQNDSVVSRILLKKATGSVTVFAFAEGEGLSEHSTPHDALVLILDGRAEITIGGEQHLTEAGQALLLPADIPHALHAPGPFKMLLIMIRSA